MVESNSISFDYQACFQSIICSCAHYYCYLLAKTLITKTYYSLVCLYQFQFLIIWRRREKMNWNLQSETLPNLTDDIFKGKNGQSPKIRKPERNLLPTTFLEATLEENKNKIEDYKAKIKRSLFADKKVFIKTILKYKIKKN